MPLELIASLVVLALVVKAADEALEVESAVALVVVVVVVVDWTLCESTLLLNKVDASLLPLLLAVDVLVRSELLAADKVPSLDVADTEPLVVAAVALLAPEELPSLNVVAIAELAAPELLVVDALVDCTVCVFASEITKKSNKTNNNKPLGDAPPTQ